MANDEDRPLTVMTYNVRRCLGLDGLLSPARIAETILQCEADVVALQELDVGRMRSSGVDQAQEIARLIGATDVHFHPALKVFEELYGDAILTSLPSRLVRAGALPAGGRRRFLGEPRGALWIAVQWRGREIQIVNTHLGLGRRERLAQIGALLGPDWLGSPDCRAPRVFLGDLNSFPGGRVYRAVAALLCDAQRAVAGRPRPTYPAHLPIFRIDHVFASEDMAVESVRAWDTPLARVASDHLPLVVRLRPPSGTSRPDGIAMRAEPLRRTRTEGSG